MKTALIASLLVATSFAASAMYERMNTVPMNKQSETILAAAASACPLKPDWCS